MQNRVVSPCPVISGSLRMPGDKSISHRVAMLAGIADGTSRVSGYLDSEDCLNTLAAMEQLGAQVSRDQGTIDITGTGGPLGAPAATIDLGNSGTGVRLLAGLLAGQSFQSEITGDASIRRRPMLRIKDPLEQMGGHVELLGDGDCAPIRITGQPLNGVEYALPMASAQVKSCVLLATLFAEGETRVLEPQPTRDHTERMLRAMGYPVDVDGLTVTIGGAGAGGPGLRARDFKVPGDFSSSCFWLAAAAMSPGSDVRVEAVGLNPRRTGFLDVLRRMGADVTVESVTEAEGEPRGTVIVRGGELQGVEVTGDEIGNLIDELPLVAVLGAAAQGETTIRDAGELRKKESDRIDTVVSSLATMGVEVREQPDGMVVRQAGKVSGDVEIDSRGDHRIAMAFAVLAMRAEGAVTICNVDCIQTSYPQFWNHLELLTGQATLVAGDPV